MSIENDVTKPVVASKVDLFHIKFLGVTADMYFSDTSNNTGVFIWNGNHYQVFPIKIEGLEQTSDGAATRPTLSVSIADELFRVLLEIESDLLGATVIYRRTTAAYEHSSISGAPFTFLIHKKVQQNSKSLVFELKTELDLDRVYLPNHQMLRNEFPALGVNKSI